MKRKKVLVVVVQKVVKYFDNILYLNNLINAVNINRNNFSFRLFSFVLNFPKIFEF